MTSPARIRAHQRAQQAIELRLAGLKLATIAEQLGYRDATGAFKAITRQLARNVREPAEQLRELSLARLDRMLQAIWPRVLQGDLAAVGMALHIEQRRATLLGLDKPQQIDLTVMVEALATAAGRDVDEALAECDAILRRSGRHFA